MIGTIAAIILIWAIFSFSTIAFDHSKIHFTKYGEAVSFLWVALFIGVVSTVWIIIGSILK